MALQDRIAKKRELSDRNKDLGMYFNSDGTPKTVISTGKSAISKFGNQERSEKQLKDYWKYYKGDNMVFTSINTIAYNTVMCGYQLISEKPKAKQLIQMMFDRMDIDGALLDNVIYGLVCGDSFIEKVKGRFEEPLVKKAKSGKFTVSLKTASPFTMIINEDKYGREIDYQQKIGGQLLPTKLSKDDIIHFRFFPEPDSPYGISLLGPSRDIIDKMRDVDESIYNAIQRHTPKYVVTVGTQEEIPPKAVFDKIKTDLEDISSKNEFIVPGVITMSTIDESGVPSVEAYTGIFQSKTLVGLMVPQEAFSLGKGSTGNTGDVRALFFERFIKSVQHKLETQLRVELIDQILIENGMESNLVYMRFNSVTDADEERKAKWIGNLFRGFPEGKKPLSINEIRAAFGYSSVKDGDDLITGDVKTPVLQPSD